MEDIPVTIDISDLTKIYPGQTEETAALKKVSLQAKMGQIVCLLGPNGSGKTTLLKILAGLLKPTSGQIHMIGKNFADDEAEIKAQLGWLAAEERSGLYGRITGRQNLEFFSALYQMGKEEFDRVVGNLALQIGISEEMDRMMLKISNGQRQKIALARTLLHNPSILILDEPLRNLDPHTLKRVRRLLKDHLTRIQRKTIVMSTHQLDEARRVADIIVIMKDGAVVKQFEARDFEKELRDMSVEDYYLKLVDQAGK